MTFLKKFPWGTIAAVCTIAVVLLTSAIIGCGYVFSAIAAQTHNTATIFDSWWQILIFVLDLVMVPATAASYVFFFLFRKEKSSGKTDKSIFSSILFSKSLYCICVGLFAIFFIAFTVGSSLTVKNSSFINEFLGVTEYDVVQSDEGEIFNEYKSEFVKADGTLDDKAMRDNSLKVALQTATEGSVLLANNDALPLAPNSKISFFGISSSKYLLSGAGSGQLAVSVPTNFSETCRENGLFVNPKLTNAYKMLSGKYGHSQTNLGVTLSGNFIGDHCYVEYGINEAPWAELNKTSAGNISSSFAEYGAAAVMVISRNDGEDGDTNYYTSECIDGNYLDLAYEEDAILNELFNLKKQGTFKKVVLIINSASAMQMKHIGQYIDKKDLDACLWVGIGGNVSFDQVAQLLSGKANPSGKLVDTYVYDNYSAPSSVNMGDFTFATKTGLPATETYSHNDKYVTYSEGIYVGYRYYETRYEDTVLKRANVGSYDYTKTVAYPFGYGMSYTTFKHSGFNVKRVKGGYEVSVTVTNTGELPGKDVVQVYIQKPYTDYDINNKLEKASVELVGYKKTRTLKGGGDKDTFTVFVSDESFKSYDAYGYGTYILEAGDYYLSAGLNSHDALNNILAAKKKTVTDGMDYAGNADFAEKIEIKTTDTETYSKSTVTGYQIVNQFSDADPTLYEGTKAQFTNFKYLSRNDWTGTYPTPAQMDCITQRMIDDMQYTQQVVENEKATMPTFGKTGSVKLMDLWGRKFDDKMWKDLLDQITWEEAVTMVTTGGGTSGCVHAGAPGGLAKDGPAGIGATNDNLSAVMCFPSECTMAATFNDELIEELGNAFGMEILHVGYTGIYAPGANIHRSAFSGRNWEYYSEDPFISGKMLSREVKGLQNRGVIVFTKHFALNDVERNRYGVSVWANEQSIREIYLKAFEGGVTESGMNGIMSSFNRIGAIWAGKHKGLLTEVLRNEWGFVGVVQTDAYVSTHMHRALAESIVAGNDFTMGGANPPALDAYRNNATVAQALRDCCHRILYTQLHSNAMNGLRMDYKIVYNTPWWKTALSVGQITSGILALVSLAMLAACFIVTYAVNKKKKIERQRREASPENYEKVKIFFDVFSKPVTAIGSVLLAALLIVSIVLGTVYGCSDNTPPPVIHGCSSICEVCGGCNDFECEDDACKDKCTCRIPCEHACAVCGLCIDANSTDFRCEEKCGAEHKNTRNFEAEDNRVIKYAGNMDVLSVAQEEGSTERYVGGLNANVGAALKFVIECDKDCVGTLIVSVCKRQSALLFTNSMLATVNGEIVESKAILPPIGQDERDWVTFTDLNLGCINLVEGRNVIKFTVIDGQNGTGFNFNRITVKSDAELDWYSGGHVCDDVCPTCGLCTNPQCNDPVCAEKSICDMNKQEFAISDGNAIIEGAERVGDYAKFNAAGQKIVYMIKADKPVTPTLFLNIKSNADFSVNFLFQVKVNGVEITSSFSDVATEDFDISKIAAITLPYGHNEIEITSLTDEEVLFKGIVLGCDDVMSYVDKNEFLITEDCVGISGNAYKSPENFIVMNEKSQGAKVDFPVKSDASTSAEMLIEVSCGNSSAKITDILKITVNGSNFATAATLGDEIADANGFVKLSLGKVTLKAGHNDIVIEALTADSANSVRLRGISFKDTVAELGWSDESNYCRLKIEAENTKLIKASYEGREYPNVGGGFGASEGAYVGGINDVGLYCPGQAKISFKINAATAGEAGVYFGIGVSGSARAASYTVIVNGVEFNSDMVWTGSGWYDWASRYFGVINLAEGENTIEIRINAGECINVDYFIIESFSTISAL